jgi:hypothetical protein
MAGSPQSAAQSFGGKTLPPYFQLCPLSNEYDHPIKLAPGRTVRVCDVYLIVELPSVPSLYVTTTMCCPFEYAVVRAVSDWSNCASLASGFSGVTDRLEVQAHKPAKDKQHPTKTKKLAFETLERLNTGAAFFI